MKKIFSILVLFSLILPVLSSAKIGDRLENQGVRMENRIDRASTTEKMLENRANNIERIQNRIASTTASTSAKRIERLNERLQKQEEMMTKVKERLLKKELKVTEILSKISGKIAERINILDERGLDMTASLTKLAEADAKIDELNAEADKLATLIETEITEENQAQLFQDIKSAQDDIRVLARTAHALLVDTIKEIAKVLPAKTATSTN